MLGRRNSAVLHATLKAGLPGNKCSSVLCAPKSQGPLLDMGLRPIPHAGDDKWGSAWIGFVRRAEPVRAFAS